LDFSSWTLRKGRSPCYPLEKDEAFALAILRGFGAGIELFRLVGQTTSFKYGKWIVLEKSLGYVLSGALGYRVKRPTELQRATLQVVRVAGYKMNAPGVQPLFSAMLRSRRRALAA